MDYAQLDKRAAGILLTAKILALASMIPIFIYPLAAATIIGPRTVWPNPIEPAVWPVRLLLLSGVILLTAAGYFSRLPLKAAARKYRPGGDISPLLASYLLSTIIGLVTRESAAIAGLLISINTGNLFWCVVLGVLAFIFMGRNFPRLQHFRDFLQSVLRPPGQS